MKTVTVRDLQKKVGECVDVSQGDRVVITRRGRPAAILIGVEGHEWEDVVLQTSPSFWKQVEERRIQRTVPLAEARRRLERAWRSGKKAR